jgi:cobalt transporter subunit CbtB
MPLIPLGGREGEGSGYHREPGDLPTHEPGATPKTIPRTEGAAMNMTTNTTNSSTGLQSLSISQRIIAGSLALMLGLTLLVGTGFAGDFRLHNGAHDTRHAMGFPCH